MRVAGSVGRGGRTGARGRSLASRRGCVERPTLKFARTSDCMLGEGSGRPQLRAFAGACLPPLSDATAILTALSLPRAPSPNAAPPLLVAPILFCRAAHPSAIVRSFWGPPLADPCSPSFSRSLRLWFSCWPPWRLLLWPLLGLSDRVPLRGVVLFVAAAPPLPVLR